MYTLSQYQINFLQRAREKWSYENNVINSETGVNIHKMHLQEIPIPFGTIANSFNCSENRLTKLKGCPKKIPLNFNCNINKLTSLEDGPKEVGGWYSCESNLLTTLIGAPETCGSFFCSNNNLTSLEGCPLIIRSTLWCTSNSNLKYLFGIGHVEGKVYYDDRNHNNINEYIIQQAKNKIYINNIQELINNIKYTGQYSCLLNAPQEIRERFSPRILHLVDSGVYNESRILDYKTFKRIC